MCCKFFEKHTSSYTRVHIDFYPRESCEVYQYHRILYSSTLFFSLLLLLLPPFFHIVVGRFVPFPFCVVRFVSLSKPLRVRDGPNIKIHFILHRCVNGEATGVVN